MTGPDRGEVGVSAPERAGFRDVVAIKTVAAAIRFLAGEDAGYITGQVIGVNGGELMVCPLGRLPSTTSTF